MTPVGLIYLIGLGLCFIPMARSFGHFIYHDQRYRKADAEDFVFAIFLGLSFGIMSAAAWPITVPIALLLKIKNLDKAADILFGVSREEKTKRLEQRVRDLEHQLEIR